MQTKTHPEYLLNGSYDEGLSVLDRAFAYGDGVFRTLLVRHGVPVNWDLHHAKLRDDCERLKLDCPDEALIFEDIKCLFKSDGFGVLKIVVSRGEGARGYAVPTNIKPNRVVIKIPQPTYSAANVDEGVKLFLCSIRLSKQPVLAGIKHLNRLENVMARMEWSDPDFIDGLLLDENGFVIEGTMSNVFARFGDKLLTPDLSQSGVAGVTRARILKMSDALGLDVKVQAFTLDQLFEADEVIICNTLFGAWQVRALSNKSWNKQMLASKIRTLLEG
jgi:4-amino-4-deoxychorismate lyase